MPKKILISVFTLLALLVCYQVEHSVYKSKLTTYGEYLTKTKEQTPIKKDTQANESVASENEKAVLNQETQEAPLKKIAYLTFDDGPSAVTESIIKVLDEYNVKATFFLIASEITPEREEIVKELIASGHTIGIHTYSHKRKEIYASVDACLEDFQMAYDRIYELTNVKPTIYRFPYGSQNRSVCTICKDVMEEMSRKGLTYHDWNVDSRDFVGTPSEASIIKNISSFSKYMEPVIILHDSKRNKITAKALPAVIEKIRAAGYEFGTVEDRSQPCQCPHEWDK